MTIDSPFCFLLSCVVSKARAKAVATPSYLITAHAHALSVWRAHPIANCHEFRYSYVYAYQTVSLAYDSFYVNMYICVYYLYSVMQYGSKIS